MSADEDYASSVRMMEKEITWMDGEIAGCFRECVDRVCGSLGKDEATVNCFGMLGQEIYFIRGGGNEGKELALGVYKAVSKPEVLKAISSSEEPHRFFHRLALRVQEELAGGYLDLEAVVSRAVEEFGGYKKT